MHRTYTLLVMASIVASAPTQASGSCLSYGHSCWGAHGKRSGSGQDSGRWILSKLAPISVGGKQAQARLAQLLLAQQQAREEEGTSPEIVARDEASDEVLLMEQPPRLYQILNSLPRALDDKTPTRK